MASQDFVNILNSQSVYFSGEHTLLENKAKQCVPRFHAVTFNL